MVAGIGLGLRQLVAQLEAQHQQVQQQRQQLQMQLQSMQQQLYASINQQLLDPQSRINAVLPTDPLHVTMCHQQQQLQQTATAQVQSHPFVQQLSHQLNALDNQLQTINVQHHQLQNVQHGTTSQPADDSPAMQLKVLQAVTAYAHGRDEADAELAHQRKKQKLLAMFF